MSSFANLKESCCEANRRLPSLGLVDLTFGNVSVIDRKTGCFAIKPSGVAYGLLKPADMVVLDLDGKVVEGKLRFSSDTSTHRRLFQAFPGAMSVVHTHSRHATSFAQAGRSIPCLGTTHADYFHGPVPVTRAMTPAEIATDYEWQTGNVIVECFKKSKIDPADVTAVLVRNHAPFVWGPSIEKALEIAQALEIIAEMAINTLQISPAAKSISRALLNKHFKRKHGAQAYYGQKPGSR